MSREVHVDDLDDFIRDFNAHGRHRGEFKFWPQVYEQWWNRNFAAPWAGPVGKWWSVAPSNFEVDHYCSRRNGG